MSDDNNVIMFPKAKKDSPPQTMNEVLGNVMEVKTFHVDVLTDEIMEFVYHRAFLEGFDLSKKENDNVMELIGESIRSALLNSQGLENWLIDIAKEMFNVNDEELAEEIDEQPEE